MPGHIRTYFYCHVIECIRSEISNHTPVTDVITYSIFPFVVDTALHLNPVSHL
jgi:hypothetical protein